MTWIDGNGQQEQKGKTAWPHYNVVITDENVDFSFDRVDFVDANEIPSEYWN